MPFIYTIFCLGGGDKALFSNTTGSSNTVMGYQADVSAGDLENATVIGAKMSEPQISMMHR
jgi:hypothetical protein